MNNQSFIEILALDFREVTLSSSMTSRERCVVETSEMNAIGVGVVSTRISDSETAALLTYVTPK